MVTMESKQSGNNWTSTENKIISSHLLCMHLLNSFKINQMFAMANQDTYPISFASLAKVPSDNQNEFKGYKHS